MKAEEIQQALTQTKTACPDCEGFLSTYPEQDGEDDFTIVYYCDNCKYIKD